MTRDELIEKVCLAIAANDPSASAAWREEAIDVIDIVLEEAAKVADNAWKDDFESISKRYEHPYLAASEHIADRIRALKGE